jgi:hypothetical protein
MKLGKLLAAGKSIVNGRAEICYRASKQIYLPKFGPAKNPFKQEMETAKPVSKAIAAPVKKEVAAKTQKLPAIPPAREMKTNWTDKLNPISIFRAAPVENSRPTVQAELSLDSVKVVHNDLSDADVEVVPIKSRSPRETTAPELSPAKKSWEYLGERLFGVETT